MLSLLGVSADEQLNKRHIAIVEIMEDQALKAAHRKKSQGNQAEEAASLDQLNSLVAVNDVMMADVIAAVDREEQGINDPTAGAPHQALAKENNRNAVGR